MRRVRRLKTNFIYTGDCLEIMRQWPDECINMCVTSPPYWGLRDYGIEGQLGLEKTPEEYIEKMVEIFNELKRVLKRDGTLWLNMGNSYAGGGIVASTGSKINKAEYINFKKNIRGKLRQDNPVPKGFKPKDLLGVAWMLAFALQVDGWYLRSDIIWHKPNPMPESVTDRPTKAHEYLFLLSKSKKYYYDIDAIREEHTHKDAKKNTGSWKKSIKDADRILDRPYSVAISRPQDYVGHIKGRNKRDVWKIPTRPFKEAHFAVFPERLIEPCILAGCPEGGIVCDPFIGSGTTGVVSLKLKRKYVGIELSPKYVEMADKRINQRIKEELKGKGNDDMSNLQGKNV